MLTVGPLAFASPWILTALLGLPVIWWLLRVMPPIPKRIQFPAVRLLLDLEKKEETPVHTPWWLLLLRLALSALIILALADPILNPQTEAQEADVLVIVVDDTWAAAPQWGNRQIALDNLLEEADRSDMPVILVNTAPRADRKPLDFNVAIATDVGGATQVLEPQPFLADRETTRDDLAAIGRGLAEKGMTARVVWLSDGIERPGTDRFAADLSALGPLSVFTDPPALSALALNPPGNTANGFSLTVQRAASTEGASGTLRAIGNNNRLLARADFQFAQRESATDVALELPLELRNEAQRIEIESHRSAGAVVLLDERWKRRLVGIVAEMGGDDAQPLLSDSYYLERALRPYSEVETGTLSDLLSRNVSALLLSDVGQFVGDQRDIVIDWVERGGLLIRFAGPRLASQSDDLIPVDLRQGGRALGGALSWSVPQGLAEFDESSPFFCLAIPDDVSIRRQVLAQPGIDLSQRSWAQLEDGTPLVTAAPRGKGQIVLFHVTASPTWSNLPLSGLFVEMLRRTTAMAGGVTPGTSDGSPGGGSLGGSLRPLRTLDGFGTLGTPPASAKALSAAELDNAITSPANPPGLYGNEQATFALNTMNGETALDAISSYPSGAVIGEFAAERARSLMASLLLAAFLLLLIDGICALALAGRLPLVPLPARRAAAPIILAGMVFATTGMQPAMAQEAEVDDSFALAATLQTPLAYIVTGRDEVDRMSRAGLVGLSRVLQERTAMEPAAPMAVDPEQHELVFFPLIYWPVVDGQRDLTPAAIAKVDAYMKSGGTILFDTQDHQSTIPGLGGQAGNANLQRLLSALDLPPLEPVPDDHVLTKAFYLLQDFPGRWSGGRVWVEARNRPADTSDESVGNDGVSSLIIGSNDYAAAWAEDDTGRPLAAVVPGGQRQRELAFRFGVNVVMYTLTGNYKADQVHIPALLERLGQ